jgi:hypothetical protein
MNEGIKRAIANHVQFAETVPSLKTIECTDPMNHLNMCNKNEGDVIRRVFSRWVSQLY